MLRYIGRRLLQMIPVFFGATFLIFAMVYAMPGDPVQAALDAVFALSKGDIDFRLWKDILRTGSNRRDGWRFPGNDSVSFHGYLL